MALGAGSLVNGLVALAWIRVGTLAYGAAAFAPVSVVWSVWSVSVAVLTFPVQHWTIRELRRDGGAAVRRTATRLMLLAVAAGVATASVAALLGADVLRTDSWVSPVTMGVVVAAAVPIGWVRGQLVAQDRTSAAALMIGCENLLRLVGAGVVVLSGLSVEVFLGTLVLGPLILLGWPGLLRFSRAGGPAVSLRDVGELSAANSLSQVSLAGAPILMALLGAPDRLVTAVFGTLSLARAPYLVLLGASMRLTALWSDDRRRGLTRGRIAVATVLLAGVAALVGGLVGPWIVALAFGPDTALPPVATGAVSAGATLALGTLVMTSRYTTEDDTAGLARAWVLATVLGALGLAVPSSALVRVLTWFVLTEALAVVLLGSRRLTPRRPRSP
ncbi:hypothetical protein [Salsipaludibacter albus]|uniref:hypothetical protein n=1 Tax=Salsipaludibacter albus TaxID=2849650 RepID=UPI001EE3B77E|nr:hypothetical protein [Salsipaludibacter albus]MBY5161959.1 hypothetical protein [Salsipaludibacter albus]